MVDQKESVDIGELKDMHLFKGVELETLQGVLEGCSVQKLKSGEVLIYAGKPNHSIYLLLSGNLRVQLDLALQPIARLEPKELVGEISVVDGQPTTAYVVADEDCRVLVLEESTLWSLVGASPRIARNLLYIIAQRLRRGDSLIRAATSALALI